MTEVSINEQLNKIVEDAVSADFKDTDAVVEKSTTKEEDKKAEQPAVEESKKTEEDVEKKESIENKTETEEAKPEDKADESINEEAKDKEVETEVEKVPLPIHIKKDFEKDWEKIPVELQKYLVSNFESNDKAFSRYKNEKSRLEEFDKSLDSYKGYVRSIAKQANIRDADVVGNIVSWAQGFTLNPDSSGLVALTQQTKLRNPISFIKNLAKAYNLDLNKMNEVDPRAEIYAERIASLEAEKEAARQKTIYEQEAKSNDNEANINNAVEDFIVSHPDYNAQDKLVEAKMIGAIQTQQILNPNLQYGDILEKAWESIKKTPESIKREVKTEVITSQRKAAEEAKSKSLSIKSSTPNTTSATKPRENLSKAELNKEVEKAARAAFGD